MTSSNKPEPTIPPGDMRGWPKTQTNEVWAGTDNFGLADDTGHEVYLLTKMAMSARGMIRLMGRRGKRRVEVRLSVDALVGKGWTPPDYGTFMRVLEAQNQGDDAS